MKQPDINALTLPIDAVAVGKGVRVIVGVKVLVGMSVPVGVLLGVLLGVAVDVAVSGAMIPALPAQPLLTTKTNTL